MLLKFVISLHWKYMLLDSHRQSVLMCPETYLGQFWIQVTNHMTLRYSEDTDRKEEDRVAVLEYELRTAREALQQLKSEVCLPEDSLLISISGGLLDCGRKTEACI